MNDISPYKVLIVGVGGLGSSCIHALAQAGVKNISIVDKDILDISNLHRQIIYRFEDENQPKVFLAAKYIKEKFPSIEIKPYNTEINKNNIAIFLEQYDIIIDGSDNFQTKFLLNDACFFYKKIFITASVIRFEGQILSVIPGKSTCLRCIFFSPPPDGLVPTCQEAGVLGTLPGMFGMLEAMEAIRYISQKKMLYINSLFTYNALEIKGRIIPFNRNPECPICGNSPEITNLQNDSYEILSCDTDK
ncbi:HesA/MoeB/ThiF family protein [Candidatus Poribacteria bacterium]|nr:HesA/MoeB/ThiF family protein [Candidatus Poribacteria bacterium]